LAWTYPNAKPDVGAVSFAARQAARISPAVHWSSIFDIAIIIEAIE
jgi:hypothetical protein